MSYEDEVIWTATEGMAKCSGHMSSELVNILRSVYTAGYNEAKREMSNLIIKDPA